MRDTRRTRIVLGALLIVAFVLVTVDVRGGDNSPLSRVRSVAAAIFGPVERGVSAVARPVAGLFSRIGGGGPDAKQVAALRAENDQLRLRLESGTLERNRAQELDRLLRVSSLGQYRIKPAQVIAISAAQGLSWTVSIDLGSSDGVKQDMTVLDGDGLVGRITTVGPSTSTVLLAADPAFSVGARLAGSMQIGVLTGQARAPMKLQLLDPQAAIKPGDQLVTFGSVADRPFVPGVPIGKVVEVKPTPGALTRTATVKPFVNFTSLDTVGVVVNPPRTDPRDAVLAAVSPTPTATPTPGPSVSGAPAPSPSPGQPAPTPATTPAALGVAPAAAEGRGVGRRGGR
jgi:rod shape-determining protein MreC